MNKINRLLKKYESYDRPSIFVKDGSVYADDDLLIGKVRSLRL